MYQSYPNRLLSIQLIHLNICKKPNDPEGVYFYLLDNTKTGFKKKLCNFATYSIRLSTYSQFLDVISSREPGLSFGGLVDAS